MREPLAPIPRTICLAGADGAGKSTQADRLARRLQARGLAVRVCTIWDLMAAGGIPFNSKADIDAFLASLHGPARAMFLHMAMREALDRALDDRGDAIVLVVGYWLKYNATERAYGGDPVLLDALAASFPPLSLGLHLDLPPVVALARKGEVSGYESGMRGKAGFLAFQQAVAPVLADLRAHSGMDWVAIDAEPSPEDVEQTIGLYVDAWLAPC
ncbi:MAG: aminotransferase class III-fold pyridoxal phosphate-dependent enzyme [Cyanobacteria bacterium RYN_339]|nr:aminotransferase class III-fold pyridoxal phosphate-dependent enzyme [Cyanobacteria bacterium RYN_339]